MKSVDQIVQRFQSTVKQLNEVSAALTTRAAKAREQVVRLSSAALQDEMEASRAERIAQNITKLIEE
jgi:hypothetical protein